MRTPGARRYPASAVILLGAICVGCIPFSGSAESLREPRSVSGSNHQLRVTLTARNGSAVIKGFGRIDGLYLYAVDADEASLLPAVWRVNGGDALRLTLLNRLACAPPLDDDAKTIRPDVTNVHFHGAFTSPHDKDRQGRYGDFAFVQVASAENCASDHEQRHHAGLRRESGKAEYLMYIPVSHPSGYYWYHPHVHEVSGSQVGGGMSGVITIGSLWDYASIRCDPDPSHANRCLTSADRRAERRLEAKTDQHLLMLKDLQLTKTSAGRWKYDPNFDSTLCGDADASEVPAMGYCESPDRSKRWLFTVNGQFLPEIVVGGGRSAVLRIANVSANVTHELAIRLAAPDGSVRFLPFQVIAKDGVQLPTAAATAVRESIIMMPASRAEIYLSVEAICGSARSKGLPDLCAQPIRAALVQKGFSQVAGDTWPPIELAHLVFETRGILAQRAAAFLQIAENGRRAAAESAATSAARLSSGEPNRHPRWFCDEPGDGSERLEATTLDSNQYRLFLLKNANCLVNPPAGCDAGDDDNESFGMVTDGPRILTTDDVANTTIVDPRFRRFNHDRVDLCVGAPIGSDYRETWFIKNDAEEIHNFHLHQGKFTVLKTFGETDDARNAMVSNETATHDTFPIYPGGWIKISVAFDRPEQVGKYPYHCHILEHEDKGMMSVIQVVDTSSF